MGVQNLKFLNVDMVVDSPFKSLQVIVFLQLPWTILIVFLIQWCLKFIEKKNIIL